MIDTIYVCLSAYIDWIDVSLEREKEEYFMLMIVLLSQHCSIQL